MSKGLSNGWPLFYKEQLILGNPSSNIAVCTLWTRKDMIEKYVDKEKVALIGNLYTVDGISYMIRNVLANPVIRYILLTGEDLMNTGEALISLMEKGIDTDHKIKGKEAYVHKAISKEYIDLFRNNVKIIDLRGRPFSELENEIDKISQKKLDPFSEPIVISEENTPAEFSFAVDTGYKISGNSLSETWLNALDVVMKFGEIKESEYKIKQKEFLNLVSVVDGDEESIPEFVGISKQDLDTYVTSFFSPEKPEGVDYSYGERLFSYFISEKTSEKANSELSKIIDQVKIAEERLRNVPFTRRAIAVTWNVKQDINSENPPCLINILFSVKFNALYLTAEFRSHDIFGAWFLNAYALRELQKRIAKDLGLKLGALTILSISAHIYENNWTKAKEILAKNFANLQLKFIQDPFGYFIISVDQKEQKIIVKHKLNDGRDSGFVFEGASAEALYKKIVHEHLVSRLDHAAYLGKELERAELALRQNKEYVQDVA
ncbi:MAG: thymidylate synthase [Candidatus Micrarchaeia archaeon]